MDRWWERVPPALVDVALAAVMAVANVALIAVAGEEGAREPDLPAYGLGLGMAALVLARRRRPVGVLLASWAVLTVYHALDYPATGLAIPLSAALYTAAAAGHLRWALLAVVSQLGLGSAYRLLVEGEPLTRLLAGGSLLDAALMVALVFLGEAVHSRRAWTAEVRERLRRADEDREREAQRRVGEERLRIARELHDVLAHTVAVIAVQAGVATDVLDDAPEQGLRVGLAVAGEVRPLPTALDLTAYRILQESLTNVLRHAGAAAVDLVIDYQPDAVVLSVVDDGHGVGAVQGDAGHGLAGMRERAAALGGQLDAGPQRSGGFRVVARLPG